MLYLIWRPVASILPATPFLPTPPLQLSSSLLPPSPPHLPLHTRACPTIVHIYIFISRLSHTQSQTAKSRSRVSSQPACVHYTVLLCALWLMWNDGTVVLSSSSSFSSYLKSFHVSDIKLILQLSEKISVWYCETAEETTECVLNRYHTRPKLAVPSVQQLIQCMRESVIPAKTFPVRVFGVFLWRLKNFSDCDQVSVQPCCLQLALIANTKARITKLPILWRLSKRSQYDRVMNVCSCNWQQTQREEITILKLKTKRSVWPSQ